MKHILVPIALCFSLASFGQDVFHQWFGPATLRVDYLLAGDHENTEVYFLDMKKEPFWGGSRTNLVDTFRYGEFMMEVTDRETGNLIYSRGFCTLFNEWQTTAESKQMRRAFRQVALMPFPLKPVVFELHRRERSGEFQSVYRQEIDPSGMFIRKEPPMACDTTRVWYSGDPSVRLDIAFFGDGYTEDEQEQFHDDVKKFTDNLFSTSPFDRLKHLINIWSVFVPSPESGTDIPGEGIYRETALNTTDYTFGLSRYITTTDLGSLHDQAAAVPSDQLVILINSERYGGGGIFNHYACATAGHPLSLIVMVHEFGHSFAGLGDEYYTSEVAYEDFYPLDVEPWEPNLTTLVDFESKWKDMLEPGTPVPTPAESPYEGVVGVYEGGGYVAKGVYRPFPDCRMHTNEAPGFCPVCCRAIERMVRFYSE